MRRPTESPAILAPRRLKELTEVDLQDRFDQLLGLAERLGLTIRREPLGGEGGGYCVIKGKGVLFVDTLADLETRYDRTLTTLARLPQIEEHFVSPELRDELVRAKG